MIVFRKSDLSGEQHEMELPITEDDFDNGMARWLSGTPIQHAFPTLTIDQREFIMTGITPAEWAEFTNQLDEEKF